MTKTISRLGDRLLGSLLKKEEAGAADCVVCPRPVREPPRRLAL